MSKYRAEENNGEIGLALRTNIFSQFKWIKGILHSLCLWWCFHFIAYFPRRKWQKAKAPNRCHRLITYPWNSSCSFRAMGWKAQAPCHPEERGVAFAVHHPGEMQQLFLMLLPALWEWSSSYSGLVVDLLVFSGINKMIEKPPHPRRKFTRRRQEKSTKGT